MIRLVCVVEVDLAETVENAEHALNAFREAVQPIGQKYGLMINLASEQEIDMAQYAPEVIEASKT